MVDILLYFSQPKYNVKLYKYKFNNKNKTIEFCDTILYYFIFYLFVLILDLT